MSSPVSCNPRAGPEAQKRELLELQAIYRERGLSKELARQVGCAQRYKKNIIVRYAPQQCC